VAPDRPTSHDHIGRVAWSDRAVPVVSPIDVPPNKPLKLTAAGFGCARG
jgi:hypothetical protein